MSSGSALQGFGAVSVALYLRRHSARMPRRVCRSFLLARKVDVVAEINDANLLKTDTARKFGIAEGSLSGVVRGSERILDRFNDGDLVPKQRRMRTAVHKYLEAVLLANLSLNGDILCAKVEGITLRSNIVFVQRWPT